jgi:hypothetical protein
MKKRIKKKYTKLVGQKALNTIPFPKIKSLTRKYGRYASILAKKPNKRNMRQLVVYKGNFYTVIRTAKAWRKVTHLKYPNAGVDIVDTM